MSPMKCETCNALLNEKTCCVIASLESSVISISIYSIWKVLENGRLCQFTFSFFFEAGAFELC